MNIEVDVTAVIDASPDEVFSALSDPSHMNAWVRGVQSGSWVADSGLEPGRRFKMEYRYARRTSEITMEVISAEPGRSYAYRTVEGPYPIEAYFSLSPDSGGTQVSYRQVAHSDSKLSALGFALTGWLARPMMRRSLRKDLVKLGGLAKPSPANG